jgi:hypothetical protein
MYLNMVTIQIRPLAFLVMGIINEPFETGTQKTVYKNIC